MAKIFNNSNDFKNYLKNQNLGDFLSGTYLSKENDAMLTPEANREMKNLYKVMQEKELNVGHILDRIEDHLNAIGYKMQIIDNGDNEYTIAYVKNAQKLDKMSDAQINEIANQIIGNINIPKFKFAAPKDTGLTKHNSQAEINQRVIDVTVDGAMYAFSQIEKLLLEQERKLTQTETNFIKAMKEGNGRRAANSVKYTTNRVMNKMPAIGAYRASNDELWKARQGVGSKQSLAIRRNYIDIEPIIENIVQKAPQLIRGYRSQNNKGKGSSANFGASFERTKELVKQNIMQMFAQYGSRRNFDDIQKEIESNKTYRYLLSDNFARDVIKEYGKQINKLHPYIGTSQEGSLKHYLVSLASNADLGYMGGLDDPSSRKRVQVANTLTLDGVKKTSLQARKDFTKKGVAFTRFQKQQGGISSEDLEQRLFGIVYATNEEIVAAQNKAYAELLKKYDEKEAKVRAGFGVGAHSGGVFYTHNIERALDAVQVRNKNLSEEAIKEREAIVAKKIKDQSKVHETAIKQLLAESIGSKASNISLLGKETERIRDGKKTYDFGFQESRKMSSGQKILTDAEYDRLTASAVSPLVLQALLENRYGKTQAQDIINKYKIGFIKQTSGVDYRNVSGYAQDYMNVLLDTYRDKALAGGKKTLTQADVKGLLDQPLLKGWFGFDEKTQDFYAKKNRDFSKAADLRKFINDLNALSKNTDLMGENFKLSDVFSIDKDGNLNIDFKKFVGLTGAQQFNGYNYGTPDSARDSKIMRADYRWKGAINRTLNFASMGTGSNMALLYGAFKGAMGGDSEDRLAAEKQARLSQAFEENLKKTRTSRNKGWKAGKSDVIMAYGPMGADYEAFSVDENGNLKPLSKGKTGYIDLSKDYQDVVEYDSHGNIFSSSYQGSLTQMIDKVREKKNGNLYLLPGGAEEGQYGFRIASGDKEIMGQAVALTGVLNDMFSRTPGDKRGRYDEETDSYRYTQLDQYIQRLTDKEKAYKEAFNTYNESLSTEDKEKLDQAREERDLAIAEYLGDTHDLIKNKNGSIYQWQFNRLKHSAMLSAQSQSLTGEIFKGSKENTSGSVFMNVGDMKELIRKAGEESGMEHNAALRGMLEYLYGTDYQKHLINAKGKKINPNNNRLLEQFILDSVTYDSEIYNRRLQNANGGKIRGLFGAFGRFPFSEGLDSKYAEAFAGANNQIGKGKIRFDLGLGKSVNADFDGDKIVFHMASVDAAFGSGYNKNGSQLTAQMQKAVDFQNAMNAAIGAVEFLDLTAGSNLQSMSSEDITKMFNERAQAAGALASRTNKSYTGLLSNLYQTVTESMAEPTPEEIDAGNEATKDRLMTNALVRAMFASFTQDAISSKKVFKRMSKKYGTGDLDDESWQFSSEYLTDIDKLIEMLRDPRNYKTKEGIGTIIDKARDMGILDSDEKGLFSNRVMSTFMSYAQSMYAGAGKNFAGLDDPNFVAFANSLGVTDPEKREELLSKTFKYDDKGNLLTDNLQSEEGAKLWGISKDLLVNAISKYEKRQGNVGIASALLQQGKYLPGNINAANNPLYRLGQELILPGTPEYEKLAENLKLPEAGYDKLSTAATGAKEAIEAEAAAEQAKIAIANKEGKAIGSLSEEYTSLKKQVHEASKTQEEFFKNSKISKTSDKAVTTYTGDIFQSHFGDTTGFEKNIRNFIEAETKAGHKIGDITKNKKSLFSAIGYEDEAEFNSAREALFATMGGTIADTIEETMGTAARLGYDFKTFDEVLELASKNPDLKKILDQNEGRKKGYNALMGSGKDQSDFDRMLQVMYGKDYPKIKKRIVGAGEAMYRQSLALAGGDTSELGSTEGFAFNVVNGKQAVHGYFDRELYGTTKVDYWNPMTGSFERKDKQAVNVTDKKWATKVSDGYLLQVMQYVRAEEAIRDSILKSTGFDKGLWANKDNKSYRKEIYDNFFNSSLGGKYSSNPKAANYLSQERFEHLIGESGMGAAILGTINLVNKKGKGGVYNIGETLVGADDLTHLVWSKNADVNAKIEDYLARGVSAADWDPSVRTAYQNAATRLYGAEYSALAYEMSGEKKGKVGRKGTSANSKENVFKNLRKTYNSFLGSYKLADRYNVAIAEAEAAGLDPNSDEYKNLLKNKEVNDRELVRTRAEYKKALEKAETKTKRNGEIANFYNWSDVPDYVKYKIGLDEDGYLDLSSDSPATNPFRDSSVKQQKDLRKIAAKEALQEERAFLGTKKEIHQLFDAQAKVGYGLWENEQKRSKNTDPTKDQYFDIVQDDLTRQQEEINNAIADWKLKHGYDDQGNFDPDASGAKMSNGKGETINLGTVFSTEQEAGQKQLELMKAMYLLKQKTEKPAPAGGGFLGIDAYTARWAQRLMSGGMIYTFIRTIRKGIQDLTNKAKQLDQAMTNLRIVTGEDAKGARELISTYSKMGKELGATTLEITQSATAWARQGYEMAEVNELIKSSMYLSKLGMIDANTAVKDLTSAMHGFKMEASESMSIVDKFTALDVKAATTAGDIAQGLAQFANLAKLNGVSIDQASAYVATIADVNQKTGAEVGQSLKTIMSRYGNVKAGAYNKLNLDSESTDTNEKLNDVERVLTKMGISIRDTNLEFKDFDKVLDEIASKWELLDNVSKKAIANAFAGKQA